MTDVRRHKATQNPSRTAQAEEKKKEKEKMTDTALDGIKQRETLLVRHSRECII
jgi:hypothetical protein